MSTKAEIIFVSHVTMELARAFHTSWTKYCVDVRRDVNGCGTTCNCCSKTCNLACIDLLMNPNCMPKATVNLIYFTGQNCPPKKVAVNGHY